MLWQQRGRPSMLYASTTESAGLEWTCAEGFFYFESTHDTKHSDTANEHVPNLVCFLQFCSKCQKIWDIEQDCFQCGKRIHSSWNEPVGDMLSYFCESHPWVENIIVISHNAKACDLKFILTWDILLKCQVKLIMNWMKVMFIQVEQLVFLDSVSFLPFALRKLPKR